MIRLQDVSLFFGARVLFDNLSFTISPGEKLAICGRNGSGKTSLFKLLLKQMIPDSGFIEIQGDNTIGYLHQELPPDRGNSVIEEVLESLNETHSLLNELKDLEAFIEHETSDEKAILDCLHRIEDIRMRLKFLEADKIMGKAEKILAGLGFKEKDLARKVSDFSGGWRMRIEIAKLLMAKPAILLLDEPNNHLDILSLQWLENYLKEYEGTVLLISHDLMFLDNFAKRIIEIDRGKIYDFKGNYTEFKSYRAERKELEINEFNAQQRIIQHKENLIEKFRYKASKAAFAQSLISELDRMDRKILPDEELSSIKLRFKPSIQSGKIVLEVKSVFKSYGNLDVLRDVNIVVERGSKISFIGGNGNGKTTLVKMICGKTDSTAGIIHIGHNVKIGYYAQEHGEVFVENKTALEVVEDSSLAEMRPMVRKVLGGLGFSGEDVEKKLSVLSGGEKARIRLASLIVNEHNLLILDEPTHHLDLSSKDRLKESLKHYEGTLIVVSHDRDFLKGLADKTILFEKQGIKVFEGDIEYYLEKNQNNTIYSTCRTSESKNTEEVKVSDLNHHDRKKLQRQAQSLEKDILKLEESIAVLNLKMQEPSFYQSADYEFKMKEYQEQKIKLDQTIQLWENLVSKLSS